MLDWIDIHTHNPGHGISVLDPCLGEVEIPKAAIVYRSLGIHPQFIRENSGEELRKIEQSAISGEIVAIGEAGLDRNSSSALSEQLYWFRRQAEIATRFRLPLLIHGVRAIPEIIALHNDFRDDSGWIMHGFNGRKELLCDLLHHGFFISVGHHLLNPESNIYRNLPEIPDDLLFFETDASKVVIEDIYRAAAVRKGVSVGELQQIVKSNFERIFIHGVVK